jgi:hypothetical protein
MKRLSDTDLQKLRSTGLLKELEIAFKDGDIIIAENVITKARRVVEVAGLVLETSKQVLCD